MAALAAYALDTLANVKAYLNVTDTARDDTLIGLINSASQEIMRETGREFAPPASSIARTVEYRVGSGQIRLSPYEARSVTAITLNYGATDQLVLSAGDWQLEPITNPDGVWDTITLAKSVSYTNSGSFDRVPASVTGTWGWAAVPPEAIKWLHKLVEDAFRGDVAFYADADGSVQSAQPVTVPYAMREEMLDWRRPYIGAA